MGLSARAVNVDWGREYDRQLKINTDLWDRIWDLHCERERWFNAFMIVLVLFLITACIAVVEAL